MAESNSIIPDWVSRFIPVVATAAMTWVGSYFISQQSQAVRNERIDNQIGQIKDAITSLQSTLNNGERFRYTSEDAGRDRAAIMGMFDAQNRRLDGQDSKLKGLADDVRDLLMFKAATDAKGQRPNPKE